MKIETAASRELVLSLEKRGDETHLVCRDGGKPVTLGTLSHNGYSLDKNNPISLTLTEQGKELLKTRTLVAVEASSQEPEAKG